MNYHQLTPEECLHSLQSDLQQGLSSSEVHQRLQRFGPNSLQLGPPISAWKILLGQFQDLMVLILLLASLVALLAWAAAGAHGLPADAIVIGAILVLNALLGFVQEYRAEQTMQSLQELATPSDYQVLRQGKLSSVKAVELVPGDVVKLQEGDRVPADGQLLRSHGISVDQSMLTGESLPVEKAAGACPEDAPVDQRHGSLHSGTSVLGGQATMLVTATGNSTELGQLAQTLQHTKPEPTPLQERLAVLGGQIGKGVLVLSCLITLTVLALEGKTDLPSITRVLMFAVALAVAAVPEGLPAVMTISLAVGTRRLARHQAVVRKMAAVETLGSVTVIATDKTGTITQNRLSLQEHFGPLSELLRAGVLANGARWVEGEPQGDPVDVAIMRGAAEHGLSPQALQQEWTESERIPFSSERARMDSCRNGRWFVKGSLEAVSGGQVEAEVRQAELEFASRGLRVLALGEAPVGEKLKLLGLLAFGDPPRPEAREAIQRCHAAGIRVVMLTGDHPTTALAVAKQVGLCPADGQVTLGSDPQLSERLADCNVFARVSPANKLALVEGLLRRGEVVAMTGDGVNDAPALKKVHVGVAMGSGSSVALEASQVVLLDDNFATLVRAVRGGREVYLSLQQFVAFLFSGNFGVVLAMFMGSLLARLFHLSSGEGLLLPLTAGQILWMNLAVDGAPAVAFSLGEDQPEVMNQPPRRPDAPILSRQHWTYLMICGAWVALGLLLVLDWFYPGGILTGPAGTVEYARSAGFYYVVCARLCNAFNFSRFTRAIGSAIAVSWLATLAVLYWGPLQTLFGVVPLAPEHLAALTLVSPSVLLWGRIWRTRTN
ncbi:cation-transporting P-type ATPase [bacterium]|nr:cation-transporting P-type ATPase [bacterium]